MPRKVYYHIPPTAAANVFRHPQRAAALFDTGRGGSKTESSPKTSFFAQLPHHTPTAPLTLHHTPTAPSHCTTRQQRPRALGGAAALELMKLLGKLKLAAVAGVEFVTLGEIATLDSCVHVI